MSAKYNKYILYQNLKKEEDKKRELAQINYNTLREKKRADRLDSIKHSEGLLKEVKKTLSPNYELMDKIKVKNFADFVIGHRYAIIIPNNSKDTYTKANFNINNKKTELTYYGKLLHNFIGRGDDSKQMIFETHTQPEEINSVFRPHIYNPENTYLDLDKIENTTTKSSAANKLRNLVHNATNAGGRKKKNKTKKRKYVKN